MEKLSLTQKQFQILNNLQINIARIKYPSKIDDWKTFEKNNSTSALNVLNTKEMEIYPACLSK